MKRKWAKSGAIAFVFVGVLVFSYISSASSIDTSALNQRLVEQGVKINSLSASGKELQVGIQSEGTDKLTPDDIRAIREIRNEVRSQVNKSLKIKNLRVQIAGQKGNVIYDGTINDITAIPDFVKKPENKLEVADVKHVLSNALAGEGYTVSSLEVLNSPLEGKLAELVIQLADIAVVNDSIPAIELLISKLNDSAGTGITQYNLSIEDKAGEQIIYLTADLVYRDFYWWQSTVLNGETWTKSKPRTPPVAPDVPSPE